MAIILLLIDVSLTDAGCMFNNCQHYKEMDFSNFKAEKIKRYFIHVLQLLGVRIT